MPLNKALQAAAAISPMPWDALDIQGLGLLKGWAIDVGKALCAPEVDPATVQLAGRACAVESSFLSGAALGRAVADAAGLPYVSLQPGTADFVAVVNCITTPTVIHLEPGAWQADIARAAQESQGKMPAAMAEQLQQIQKAQSMLLDVLQGRPVVYVTFTKSLATFSTPLQRVGGFDRQIALGGPMLEMSGALWLAQLQDCAAPSLYEARAKVGALLSSSDTGHEGVALRLRRLSAAEGRPIEFADLIDVVLRGTRECQQAALETEAARNELRRVAWHEAGHALITVLDSGGNRVPDYASAFPSLEFGGVVYSVREQREPVTYASVRHEVRVKLAGRAAEEVAFGSANVSTGAGNDLETATQRCSWVFARGGFAPGMDDDATQSGVNLAVMLGEDATAMTAVRAMVQKFLATEYQHVLAALRQNRNLLETLAHRLEIDRIVDQVEMRQILRELVSSIESA